MVLSEVLRSRAGAMAVAFGLFLAGQVLAVPDGYRVLSQIWDWMPMKFVNTWNVFDQRLVPLFGGYLTSWQLAPVCYILGTALLALAGKWAYNRYQVAGR